MMNQPTFSCQSPKLLASDMSFIKHLYRVEALSITTTSQDLEKKLPKVSMQEHPAIPLDLDECFSAGSNHHAMSNTDYHGLNVKGLPV